MFSLNTKNQNGMNNYYSDIIVFGKRVDGKTNIRQYIANGDVIGIVPTYRHFIGV